MVLDKNPIEFAFWYGPVIFFRCKNHLIRDSVETGKSGATFMLSGPWGWVGAGAYFLIDMGVKSYSGKSITENAFDRP